MRGTGAIRKPEIAPSPLGASDASAAVVATVNAWVDEAGAFQPVPGYSFERLQPGNRIEGPAIIWSPITTLVVASGQEARLDGYRNLVIATQSGRQAGLSTGARKPLAVGERASVT